MSTKSFEEMREYIRMYQEGMITEAELILALQCSNDQVLKISEYHDWVDNDLANLNTDFFTWSAEHESGKSA